MTSIIVAGGAVIILVLILYIRSVAGTPPGINRNPADDILSCMHIEKLSPESGENNARSGLKDNGTVRIKAFVHKSAPQLPGRLLSLENKSILPNRSNRKGRRSQYYIAPHSGLKSKRGRGRKRVRAVASEDLIGQQLHLLSPCFNRMSDPEFIKKATNGIKISKYTDGIKISADKVNIKKYPYWLTTAKDAMLKVNIRSR